MKARRIVLAALLAVCTLLIWGNSLLTSTQSFKISDGLINRASTATGHNSPSPPDVAVKPNPLGTNVSSVVRKGAHLAEFFLLGALWAIFWLYPSFSARGALSTLLCGLGTSIADETMQIFSHRGAHVQDVWLDLFGYGVAVLCTAGVLWLLSRRKKNP